MQATINWWRRFAGHAALRGQVAATWQWQATTSSSAMTCLCGLREGGGSTYAQLEGSGSPRQVIQHDFLPNKNHNRVGPVRAGDILADNLRLVARISKMT